MRAKIFGIILVMILAMQTTFAAPFSGNAKTKRIPAGTKFDLKMLASSAEIVCEYLLNIMESEKGE